MGGVRDKAQPKVIDRARARNCGYMEGVRDKAQPKVIN